MATRSFCLPVLCFLFWLTPALGGQTQCRSTPQDASWPQKTDWDALNRTVDGRLIATIPIGAPCHTSLFDGSANPLYDVAACAALRDVWFHPETHLSSSSSPMAYPFSGNSCNPWLTAETPCTLGQHVAYAINASKASHFSAAIQFAQAHDIRLVIRNTGHDYIGKSTGAHALAIWTHSMKAVELIDEYAGEAKEAYVGPAIKVGAGVYAVDAFRFASQHGLMVVGGNCPTVGLAGGYTQGAGHGPLSSRFGLAADQVLEWEVVTGAGRLVRASANHHADLFWALRGGGGGTYGVVVSMTVKAYPDAVLSTATLFAPRNESNADVLYQGLDAFLGHLPAIVDSGATVVWVMAPFGFSLTPAFGPAMSKAELDRILAPTLSSFGQLGLGFTYASRESPTFLTGYTSLESSWNVSDYNIGGLLISRDVARLNRTALVSAIRHVSEQTVLSGVSYNVSQGVVSPDQVAVNPYFRKTLFSLTVGTPVDYTDEQKTKMAQDRITNDLLPSLYALSPKGAAYLNEGDFQAPHFQDLFYGANYKRLLQIKDRYDPHDLFYARTAVGSHRWREEANGRLCKVA